MTAEKVCWVLNRRELLKLLPPGVAGWVLGPVAGEELVRAAVGAPGLPATEAKKWVAKWIWCAGETKQRKQRFLERVADIPGGPLGSVRWLASSLALTKETLKAGEIVLTGSPGTLIPIVGNRLIIVTCQGQQVALTIESPIAT
jgi:2-keto-4-pentenoate hydratase